MLSDALDGVLSFNCRHFIQHVCSRTALAQERTCFWTTAVYRRTAAGRPVAENPARARGYIFVRQANL